MHVSPLVKSNPNHRQKPRTILKLLFIPLILSAFSTGCGSRTATADKTQPNIILISIDTLRADHVHAYGYGRETTPVLDEMMEEGSAFLTTISPSPWTLPSHISLFTGLYPHTHGVTAETLMLNEEVATLPQLLKKEGYATGGFAACEYLSPKYGFGRGFDFYNQRRGIGAPAVCEEALKRLIQEKPKKYFLFLHFYDVHPNYEPSESFLRMFESSYSGTVRGTIQTLLRVCDGELKLTDEDIRHLEALYDGEIRQLDHQIGVFISFLKEKGLLENTFIIVTADHGEEFFDHGSVLHSRTLYDEIIRVPLIITGPDIPAGKRIAEQVQLIDVLPTILDLCGVDPPSDVSGKSLLPLLKANGALRSRYAFAEADKDNKLPNVKRAIRSERYKLYYDTMTEKSELYDVIQDPGEKANLIEAHPDVAALLRKELKSWMLTKQGNPQKAPLSEDEKRELQSLGYLH